MENPENIQAISFEILANYHKQEGQEALTYLTILFTVIIGIIGFLGSAQRIEKTARVLILFFYIGLHFSMTTSFLASMRIHSAIHKEIAIFVTHNPEIFQQQSKSPLYIELSKLHGHDILYMKIAGYALLLFMALCILSVGPNRILHWAWVERILQKSKG